jgi:hypothetical protein
MASQMPSLTAHAGLDVIGGVRGEVREPAVRQVAPEEFDGIELGRVRWQPDDVQREWAASHAPTAACR